MLSNDFELHSVTERIVQDSRSCCRYGMINFQISTLIKFKFSHAADGNISYEVSTCAPMLFPQEFVKYLKLSSHLENFN